VSLNEVHWVATLSPSKHFRVQTATSCKDSTVVELSFGHLRWCPDDGPDHCHPLGTPHFQIFTPDTPSYTLHGADDGRNWDATNSERIRNLESGAFGSHEVPPNISSLCRLAA
jgi:hypothetical protein